MAFILFFGIIILILLFTNNKLVFQLAIVACAFFMAQRGLDVPDTLAYKIWYTNPPLQNQNVEYGYAYLCYLFNKMGADFRSFLFVLALFEMEVWAWCSSKLFPDAKKATLFALCISFYGIYYWGCVLRASLAITIAFWGFYILLNKKWSIRNILGYYAIIILAATIHVSALIYLICPIFKYSIGKRLRWALLFASIVLLFVVAQTGVASYIGLLTQDTTELDRFQGYLERENMESGISFFWIISLLISLYCCYYYTKIIDAGNIIVRQFFLNMYLVGFMLLTATNNIPAGSRLSMMFTFFEFIVIFYISQQIRGVPQKMIYLCYIGCRFSYMIHSFPLFLKY